MVEAPVVLSPDVQVLATAPAAFGVLRIWSDVGEDTFAAVERALGLPLPRQPNRAAGAGLRALWTAPGEWTLIDATPEQLAGLAAACAGVLSHYADLTDARAGYRITGPSSARLINTECPLDLSEAALPAGRCAQSVFAGVGVLVDRREGEQGFRLYVDVSLAQHLEAWFAVAAEGLA
jgi:sarcosine oxidase subunit gamma